MLGVATFQIYFLLTAVHNTMFILFFCHISCGQSEIQTHDLWLLSPGRHIVSCLTKSLDKALGSLANVSSVTLCPLGHWSNYTTLFAKSWVGKIMYLVLYHLCTANYIYMSYVSVPTGHHYEAHWTVVHITMYFTVSIMYLFLPTIYYVYSHAYVEYYVDMCI